MSVKIMTYIWKYSPVKGTELLMLLALADNANDDGICYPSIGYLAHKARINERNAQKTIKSLAKKSLIKIERNAGKATIHGYTNRYIIFYEDGVSLATPVSVATPLGVSDKTPDGVSLATPKSLIEPSVKPSNARRAVVRIKDWTPEETALVETFKTLTGSIVGLENETVSWKKDNRRAAEQLHMAGVTPELLRKFYTHEYTNGYTPSGLVEVMRKIGAWLAKQAPPPAATNGTSNYASEMQKLTEERYKERGLLK